MFGLGVERAIRVALEAHDDQERKGNGAPYAVHPIQVALQLAHLGADEEVVQAGLLHDVVEDCEAWTVDRIRAEFGPRVASIVAELTEDKDLGWEERKQNGVEQVAELSREALQVKAQDKLHNLQSLAQDLERGDPEATWAAFNGGRERTQAMATRLVERLADRLGEPVAGALREALRAVLRH